MCSIALRWFGFRCTYSPARDRSWFSAWPWPVTGRSFSDNPACQSLLHTCRPHTPTGQTEREEIKYLLLFTQKKCGYACHCLSRVQTNTERRRDRDDTRVEDSMCCDLLHLFVSWKTEDNVDEGLEQHIHFEGKFRCLRESGKLFIFLTSSAVHNRREESQIYQRTLHKS